MFAHKSKIVYDFLARKAITVLEQIFI